MANWKVLTHDYRPPIQGGEPLWDGVKLPLELSQVTLDTTNKSCASGWYSADTPEEALVVAGFWPDGWSACVLEVERQGAVHVPPGGKPRSEGLRLLRRCEPQEVRAAIGRWTATWADELVEEMLQQQWAWYEALDRPERDEVAVEAGLWLALETRGLSWKLRRYDTIQAAWDVQVVWDALAARAAQAAWDVQIVRNAAETIWNVGAARTAWNVGVAGTAWNAGAAGDALSVYYTSRLGQIRNAPNLLTRGLRDAYRAGLAITVPMWPKTLGWAMME